MPSIAFATKTRAAAPDAIAPDGSEVRVLCATARGSMAVFTLAAGAVAKAVAHRIVEEIWYVVGGTGRLWRKTGDTEDITDLRPGTSIVIPVATHFQFRNDGPGPLDIVAVTMPPWPGAEEAEIGAGKWPPTVIDAG
jgi:mannose-6-phosphate isomerase-like protein (cupin superfamily)